MYEFQEGLCAREGAKESGEGAEEGKEWKRYQFRCGVVYQWGGC